MSNKTKFAISVIGGAIGWIFILSVALVVYTL